MKMLKSLHLNFKNPFMYITVQMVYSRSNIFAIRQENSLHQYNLISVIGIKLVRQYGLGNKEKDHSSEKNENKIPLLGSIWGTQMPYNCRIITGILKWRLSSGKKENDLSLAQKNILYHLFYLPV